MRRRTLLRTCGVGAAASVAGCSGRSGGDLANTATSDPRTAADGTTTVTTEAPVRLGSSSDRWSGTAVTASGGDVGAFRDAVSKPVPAVLVGEDALTGYVETTDVTTVAEELQAASFSVRAIVSTFFDGFAVCRVGAKVRFPKEQSEDAVREAFPDALKVSSAARAGGGEVWMVLTAVADQSTIEGQLQSLDVEVAAATVLTYESCSTAE